MNILRLLRVKSLLLFPALVYTGAIVQLSLVNLAETPVSNLGLSDKILHGAAYYGLGMLWMLYTVYGHGFRHFSRKMLIVSVSSVSFGIFIEVLQDTLTSYRQWDVLDIIANSVGVIAAWITIRIMKKCLIRLKAKINLNFIKK